MVYVRKQEPFQLWLNISGHGGKVRAEAAEGDGGQVHQGRPRMLLKK